MIGGKIGGEITLSRSSTETAMTTEDEMTPPTEAWLRHDTRQGAFDKGSAEWVANQPHAASMSSISFPVPPSSSRPLWVAAVKEPRKPKVLRDGPPPFLPRTLAPIATSTLGTPPLPPPGSWLAMPSPGTTRPVSTLPCRSSTMAAPAVPLSGLFLWRSR